MADIKIENHGSIVLLRPISEAGQQWLDEHISDEAQTFGKAIVAEPRYVSDIVDGMQADGLDVQ